jgi:polyisoprenoid-binding protein YceI
MIRTFQFGRRATLPALLFSFACAAALLPAPASRAQDSDLQLEPGQTKIEFSLGSTLHTVHGSFALKSSTIHFDSSSGKISGAVIVAASSGESGNGGRDSRMHREILESAKYPEIVFTAEKLTGTVAATGPSQLEVSGRLLLHGREHDVKLPVEVVAEDHKLRIAIHFEIPYVEWGLKNPSNFFLHASDKVEVTIHSAARIENPTAPR